MKCDITLVDTNEKGSLLKACNCCLGGIQNPLNPSIPTVKEPKQLTTLLSSLICGSIDCYFWIIVMFWCLRVSTGFENHFHWSLIILQCHMLTFAWFNMTPDIYIHLNMISFCRSPSFLLKRFVALQAFVFGGLPFLLLLMEDILQNLECKIPCKEWDDLPIKCCRISSINSTFLGVCRLNDSISGYIFSGPSSPLNAPWGHWKFIITLVPEHTYYLGM